ncbi:hypothetical protein FRC04_002442 [Tulasnella sp. 424]|nr:hypothetical protein FRC04_002442 [Tulasnella sp. 424]KAG8967386.1 hypothetical protein FRC05_002096 [Tulasnella sp. 425]
MELDLTDKPPIPDYTTFHQLCAEHLDQSPSALVDSPTQESIAVLRNKFLHESTPRSSAARMFAVIDQWNAAQPISKLPLELIAHIVALGFPITHHFGDRGGRLPYFYMEAISSLATISRTWRNAIIGTPSLWGLLSTELPPHINRISLQRSGTCPLMVTVLSWPNEPSSADELLDIALPHRDRWSHVDLGFIPRVREYLTSPAPRLETLDLLVDHQTATDLEPIDLFGGYAPSLQDISIYGGYIEFGSEVFRELRRLRLDSIQNESIPADQVLAILSASPLLELLGIVGVKLGFTPLPPSSTRTPIQLPHLKSIAFNNVCVEALGNILPFIHAPNCDSFRLYAFRKSDDPFDAADFLNQSFLHFDAFLPSILAFHGSSQLYLLRNSIKWLCNAPGSNTPPYFSFQIPFKMDISIPWISQFLGSEQPKPAHELSVSFTLQHVDDEKLAGLRTLSLLPNVRSFGMDCRLSSALVILCLLGDPSKDVRAQAFPRLKELRLGGTYGGRLQNLEAMLMRRYGESGRSARGPPIRIVLRPPFSRPLCGPSHTRLQFGDLRRIRTTHGVESVTLTSPFRPEGMPACIYDDASGEYCNPL